MRMQRQKHISKFPFYFFSTFPVKCMKFSGRRGGKLRLPDGEGGCSLLPETHLCAPLPSSDVINIIKLVTSLSLTKSGKVLRIYVSLSVVGKLDKAVHRRLRFYQQSQKAIKSNDTKVIEPAGDKN